MNANIHSDNEDKGYKNSHKPKARDTQPSLQKLFSSWILLQYTSIEYHSNLIIGACLANTTSVYSHFSISYLIAGSSLDKSNSFVHPYWQGEKSSTNRFISGWSQHLRLSVLMRSSYWRFFASSVWHCLWKTFAKPYNFPFFTKEFLLILDGFHSSSVANSSTSSKCQWTNTTKFRAKVDRQSPN